MDEKASLMAGLITNAELDIERCTKALETETSSALREFYESHILRRQSDLRLFKLFRDNPGNHIHLGIDQAH